MSTCVLREIFKVHETPAGFGEIKGKALGEERLETEMQMVCPTRAGDRLRG